MTHQTSDRLDLLYRISQTFISPLDLDHVLEKVMDEVILTTHAERGFLMLIDQLGSLVMRSARGMDQRAINQSDFQFSQGVVERIAREGKPISGYQSLFHLSFQVNPMGLMQKRHAAFPPPPKHFHTASGLHQ